MLTLTTNVFSHKMQLYVERASMQDNRNGEFYWGHGTVFAQMSLTVMCLLCEYVQGTHQSSKTIRGLALNIKKIGLLPLSLI